VRFALAVLVASVAQLVVYLQVGTWIGTAALLATAYIVFASLGAGWFAARRSALAGGLSALLGAAIYGVVSFFGPAATGMTAFDLLGWEARLLLAVVPYVVIGAAAGALGGWLRKRAIRAARRGAGTTRSGGGSLRAQGPPPLPRAKNR
jgi:hypothetical protein